MAQGPTPPPGSVQAPAIYFTTLNPILQFGERGTETDTLNWKLGDGVTKWKSLPYGTGLTAITGSRGGATAAVLAQLLTALAARGEITDSTTA